MGLHSLAETRILTVNRRFGMRLSPFISYWAAKSHAVVLWACFLAFCPSLRVCGAEGLEARDAAGFYHVFGDHLALQTDIPPDQSIESLVRTFDAAFPAWCDWFEISPEAHQRWRMNGYLMRDKERFLRSGDLPASLPDFANGYSRGHELWCHDQTSEEYRRHLLLHEGVHGFMETVAKSHGPPWYLEGLAELLALHRWNGKSLEVGTIPKSPAEVPRWGRIEMIQDAVRRQAALTSRQVFHLGPNAHLQVEAYAWSWAMAAFLEADPNFRERFRELPRQTRREDWRKSFEAFQQELQPLLEPAWNVFIHDLDYGYDFQRNALEFAPGTPIKPNQTASFEISVERGWQNSGVQVRKGETYQLQARGRFQIAQEPTTWWCEPPGVTIHYYRGRPLGQLLAAVLPDHKATPSWAPFAVGEQHEWRVKTTGTLYLRINESPGKLADNRGSIEVTLRTLAR